MKSQARRVLALLGFLAALASMPGAHATSLLAGAQLVAATDTLQQLLPPARSFTVTTAGTLQLQAADLGAPAPLTSLEVLVTTGGALAAKLSSAGTMQFTAAAGTYTVQVVGSVASTTPGSFTVDVRPVGASTSLLTFSDAITPPPATPADPATSTLSDTFVVSQGGAYTVTVTDLNLPAALSSVNLIIVQSGPLFTGATCSPTCTSAPVSLAAGSYDIGGFVTAGSPDQAGLYTLTVSGGSPATTVYRKTIPVGLLPAAQPLTLAATAGTLTLNDYANPVALAELKARVVQGASVLATLDAAGQAALGGASAGAAQLYVYSRAGGTAGAGAYGVKVAQGSSSVFEDAQPLPLGYSSAAHIGGYRFSTTIPAAGAYTLQLRDYAFPVGFSALRALVIQSAATVQTLPSAGSATASLNAGPATLLVFGVPSAAGSNGLFGVSLTPQSSTVPVLQQAQGVGGLFRTYTVTLATPGSYDINLTDLQLPAAFSDLALALTQGPTLQGQVFGGGRLTFNATTAGIYSLNILATLGAGSNYGAYGYSVATTPPAPVITFSAAQSSVATGQTTTLQWSSTGATSCTASGGWTGSQALSGTATTSAITSSTNFMLTCIGAGGSSNQTVTVGLSTSGSGGSTGGGGGSLGPEVLAALGVLLLRRRRSLRRPA